MNVDHVAGCRVFRSPVNLLYLLVLTVGITTVAAGAKFALGAEPEPAEAGPSAEATDQVDPDKAADDALGDAADAQPEDEEGKSEEAVAGDKPKKINMLELLVRGGWLMLPILAMSLVVVTFGLERGLGLRRRKVLPPELIDGLGRLAGQRGGLDPRQAYRLCQQFPSTAASVIKTMLLKIGRPHTELEHAVAEANEREAERLYANVRWLNLAAGISPLLGLLGTVWGMIKAFFDTANLPTGANKAELLADGIYVALVTTLSGLSVAIVAAILAHWFEGRIQRLFRELDETLLGMMPQLERFEGRLRVSKEQMDSVAAAPAEAPAAAGTRSHREAAKPAATPK